MEWIASVSKKILTFTLQLMFILFLYFIPYSAWLYFPAFFCIYRTSSSWLRFPLLENVLLEAQLNNTNFGLRVH